MKNKIRFEFESVEELGIVYKAISDLSGVVCNTSYRVLELFLDSPVHEEDPRFKSVYDIIHSSVNWRVVGPRCHGEGLHEVCNQSMLLTPQNIWMCAERGCGKKAEVHASDLVTYREFRLAVGSGSVDRNQRMFAQSSALRVSKESREQLFKLLDIGALRHPSTDEIILPQASTTQEQINQLTTRNKELEDLRNKLEQELAKFKVLTPVADRMFRFLAGLNMQDHSVADQKEFIIRMRDLMDSLVSVGIGIKS